MSFSRIEERDKSTKSFSVIDLTFNDDVDLCYVFNFRIFVLISGFLQLTMILNFHIVY